MHNMFSTTLSVTAAAVLAGSSFAAPPAVSRHPGSIDLGRMQDLARGEMLSATVTLQPRDTQALYGLLADIHDTKSPQFGQFLTPTEFRARFAPSAETVRDVAAEFRRRGLTVEQSGQMVLHLKGPVEAVDRALGIEMHVFQSAPTGLSPGERFHAPVGTPTLGPSWSGIVGAIVGLDSGPWRRPQSKAAAHPAALHGTLRAAGGASTPDQPGLWTVLDLEKYYDVKPLYRDGHRGQGHTIGIVTLASFTPSDAFYYWSSLGLNVDPNRLTVLNIDGGPGAPSDASGSYETTLDVEQSGGLAPEAKIVVYQAPNTDQGWVDAFARVVEDNTADAISTSWGEWEYYEQTTPVTVGGGGQSETAKAFHILFLLAALQGQSLFCSSGDAGAYYANLLSGPNPPPQFSLVLSQDAPASDPLITAAGGTTLAGPQPFPLPDGGTLTINVATERAWSWDYLEGYCAILGFDPVSCGIFPVGGGGGVSAYWDLPWYQQGVPGMRRSEPNQSLVDLSQTPPQTLVTLPAHFPGRNLPDVSLNADPDTGYILPYTSDVNGFSVLQFWGGTSFVAPQLAGITVLLDQHVGHRLGLLNVPLYAAAGTNAFHDITHGNNEFYKAEPGYDQATGLGTLDVAEFAEGLR
jgi:subtilase family serine protease